MGGSLVTARSGNACLTIILLLSGMLSWVSYYIICTALLNHTSSALEKHITYWHISQTIARTIVTQLAHHDISIKEPITITYSIPYNFPRDSRDSFETVDLQIIKNDGATRCVITMSGRAGAFSHGYHIQKGDASIIIKPIRVA